MARHEQFHKRKYKGGLQAVTAAWLPRLDAIFGGALFVSGTTEADLAALIDANRLERELLTMILAATPYVLPTELDISEDTDQCGAFVGFIIKCVRFPVLLLCVVVCCCELLFLLGGGSVCMCLPLSVSEMSFFFFFFFFFFFLRHEFRVLFLGRSNCPCVHSHFHTHHRSLPCSLPDGRYTSHMDDRIREAAAGAVVRLMVKRAIFRPFVLNEFALRVLEVPDRRSDVIFSYMVTLRQVWSCERCHLFFSLLRLVGRGRGDSNQSYSGRDIVALDPR